MGDNENAAWGDVRDVELSNGDNIVYMKQQRNSRRTYDVGDLVRFGKDCSGMVEQFSEYDPIATWQYYEEGDHPSSVAETDYWHHIGYGFQNPPCSWVEAVERRQKGFVRVSKDKQVSLIVGDIVCVKSAGRWRYWVVAPVGYVELVDWGIIANLAARRKVML